MIDHSKVCTKRADLHTYTIHYFHQKVKNFFDFVYNILRFSGLYADRRYKSIIKSPQFCIRSGKGSDYMFFGLLTEGE